MSTRSKSNTLKKNIGRKKTALGGLNMARSVFEKAKKHLSVAVLCLAVICCCIAGFLASNLKLEVTVNGHSLGYFKDKESFQAVVSDVEKQAEQCLGYPYVLSAAVEYKLGVSVGDSFADTTQTTNFLINTIDEITTADILTVGDTVVGAAKDSGDFDIVFSNILANYQSVSPEGKNSVIRFTEQTNIKEGLIDKRYVYSADELEKILTSPKNEVESKLPASNAVHSLSFGASLDLTESGSEEQPLLTIEEIVTNVSVEEIPFDVEKIETDTLYLHNRKIKTYGKNGSKKVTEVSVFRNGIEVSKEISSEEILTEPVTQVVYVGTAPVDSETACGTIDRPVGILTSDYGERGNEFHTGADFASPTGTPVKAALDGVVSGVKYRNGYGNYLIIDHGDGLQTLYAHCDTISAKEGDVVKAGDVIATVGSSGRSSGSHLHLEVRLNGKDLSPWDFIK